jgi:hypothetical protein
MIDARNKNKKNKKNKKIKNPIFYYLSINIHLSYIEMARILKLGLLTLMQKTNGLVGLTLSNKMNLMYNIFSGSYDDRIKDTPRVKNNDMEKKIGNEK